MSDNFTKDGIKEPKAHAEHEFSQDNLFHTFLGLFQIQTKEYKPELDILKVNYESKVIK